MELTDRGESRRMHHTAAALLDLVIPGAGQAIQGRRRAALVFFLPTLLLVLGVVALYAGGGTTGILAFLVTPGVLPAVAVVNIVLAIWGLLAVADAVRESDRSGRVVAIVGTATLVLVIAPHVWLGYTIAATNDFLDSMFASGPDKIATETDPPDFVGSVPDPNQGYPEPSDWFDESLPPGETPAPRPTGPFSPGVGTLPALGAAVPWVRPGAVPWGDDGRFDLLLLGSDAGPDRWSRRMDVMLLVEIDVSTGKVAMVGLPRNLINAPLPPGAAHDAVACGCLGGLLNSLYVEATVVHPSRWPGSGAVKGIGAVRSVVSQLTGRPVDAVLVADLWGMIKVVDAMGGIDINVPASIHDDHYPDPVWGPMVLDIAAGQQHLDGRMALAYARSRHQDSDYGRMQRQQTLLLAIREQIGPSTILNAPALFAAAKGFTWTDLPRDSLPNLVNLFGKAHTATVRHLRIVPPTYPEWLTPSLLCRVQTDIAKLLGVAPPPTAPPTPGPSSAPTPSPSAVLTPQPSVAP